MTEIKLDTNKHDIDDLIRYLDGDHHMGFYDRSQLVADIRAQLPRPSANEPTAFGSIARASDAHRNGLLWQKSPMHGKHYWESETGAVEVWSELTDVEVLRVGLGESDPEAAEIAQEAFRDGIREGRRAMNVSFHLRLREQLDEAIGAERKNAIERMISVVEELAS